MKRNLYVGGIFVAVLIALGVGSVVLQKRAGEIGNEVSHLA